MVHKAFDQLKWEAFHRHQLQAEEIARRIDQGFDALIRREDAHTFTDFGFLTLVGDPSAEFMQRSPLADLPAELDLPGLIGYFQIDADGVFTTPLLPRTGTNPLEVGIPSAELAERRALKQRIESILASNRLAEQKAEEEAPELKSAKTFADGDSRTLSVPSQAGFDRLSMRQQSIAESLDHETTSGQLGKKDVTPPQHKPVEMTNQTTPPVAQPAPAKVKRRAVRKERNVASEPAPMVAVAPDAVLVDIPAPATRVRIFESEIDPFDLSRLESGHFVLFRRVWRDGQRLIQGALIEARVLIEGVLTPIFRETALARISDLEVTYRGNGLLAIGAEGRRSYAPGEDGLAGTLLYRTRLSAPLGELELAFTVQRLDAAAGARVVIWLALILFMILVVGTWLMYRLGARQLDLVQQQQGFIYAVSHELKTPLTSIRMYSEMLREGWARDDRRDAYYGFIHDESERLSRLISNVLQLSRLSRDNLSVELEPMDSRALMALVRAKVSSQIEQAGFRVVEDCTEGRGIQVDPDAFVQIMINLVDNALKFAANAQPRLIELRFSVSADGKPFFSVRDYGPSIPKKQVKKIFRLFYRLENELTRSTQGTGIGLALVRELAEAMDARVQVINRKPGAEFRIVFR